MNDPAANSHIQGDYSSSVPVTSASPVLSSLSATKSLRGKRVKPPSNSNPTGRSGILVSLATDTPSMVFNQGPLKNQPNLPIWWWLIFQKWHCLHKFDTKINTVYLKFDKKIRFNHVQFFLAPSNF
jgi:hypothetical protein